MTLILLFINATVVLMVHRYWVQINESAAIKKSFIQIHSYKKVFDYKDILENRYINQTFLKEKINFNEMLVLYLLWCLVLALICFTVQMKAFLLIVTLIFIVLFPLMAIEKVIDHIDISIDKGIFNLLTQINARLIKSEDILSALQEAQQVIKNKYILKILTEFNQTIKFGVAPAQAFAKIQINTHNEYLRYLFLNIELVYLRRGNVPELMRALENEYTSIQIEINKRKIELEHEKNMTLFSMLMVIFTTIKIMKDNDYIIQFYRVNPVFTLVLAMFALLGIGFVVKASVSKY